MRILRYFVSEFVKPIFPVRCPNYTWAFSVVRGPFMRKGLGNTGGKWKVTLSSHWRRSACLCVQLRRRPRDNNPFCTNTVQCGSIWSVSTETASRWDTDRIGLFLFSESCGTLDSLPIYRHNILTDECRRLLHQRGGPHPPY